MCGGLPLKSWRWGDAILFVRVASGQRGAEGSPSSSGVSTGSLRPRCPLTGPEGHSFQRKAPSSPSPSNQWKVLGEGLHYRHGCLESRKKFPELPALTLKSAPFKKVKKRNESKPPSSAGWEPRGPGAICIFVCGGLGDADDRLGSQCFAPTCGRWDGSLPSSAEKEATGRVLATVTPS